MSPETHKPIPYGSHPLQTLDITLLPHHSSQLWVIYIHGGAWRDPRITSLSFSQTATHLLSNPHIAGLASLNHRLSPHPQFPSDDNVARHPDHVQDILSALGFLREKYSVEKYVLVGHSSGAALGMQVLPLLQRGPVGMVGLAGLYDFVSLVEAGGEGYAEFVTGAFGADKGVWRDVSPASLRYEDWRGRWIVLGHSRGDELVGWEQVEKMERGLEECGFTRGEGESGFEVLELEGRHDQIWEEGREAARAIELCIQRLVSR